MAKAVDRKPTDKPTTAEKSSRESWLVSKGVPPAAAARATKKSDPRATAADEVQAAIEECRKFPKANK